MKIPSIKSILDALKAQRPLRRSPRIWRRRRIGAFLLLVLLAGLTLGYRYYTAGQRLRALAIDALERVTGGQVTVEQAQFSILEQVRLKGVRIYPPQESLEKDNLVFAAQDVILTHEPLSLLQQRLVIRRITAFGTTLNIIYNRQTEKTNLHALIRPGGVMPEQERPNIVLRDGEVLYHEVDRDQKTRVARQQVAGSILPDPSQHEYYRFELHSADEGLLQHSSLSGRLNLQTGEFAAEGGFLLEMVDFANLPERVAAWWQKLGIDNPQGRVVTRNHYDPRKGHELQVTLDGGAFTVPVGKSRLALHDVIAKLNFFPHGVTIEECRGIIGKEARFLLTGDYAGYRDNEPFTLELQTEGLIIPEQQWRAPAEAAEDSEPHQALIGELLALLPKQTQEAIREFEPTGAIDFIAKLHREEADREPAYQIICQGKGAAARYYDFPYPLQNVRGNLVFEPDHITIGPLTARRGRQKIDLQGWWRNIQNQSTYEVHLQAENVTLDDSLYQCLSPWQQQLWKKLAPTGETEVSYRAVQSRGKPLEEFLTAKMTGGMQYQDFPLPLTEVRAELNYDPNELSFHLTHAATAGGTLAMTGRIQHAPTLMPADLNLKFQGLRLDGAFADILNPEAAAFWKKLGLSVVADGEGTFRLPANDFQADSSSPPAADKPVQYDIQFDIADGRFCYQTIPYELTGLRGKGRLTESRLTFTDLQAEHQASHFTLSGWVQNDEGYELSLRGNPLLADADLHQALEPFRFGIWEQVRFWGPMLTEVQLHGRPQAAPYYRAIIEPQGCRLRLVTNDYELTQVTGRIVAEPNRLRMEPLVSAPNGRRLEVRGLMSGDAREHELDLGLEAQNWPLNAKLLDLLPGTAGRLFAQADPNGLIEDMNLHIVRHLRRHQEPVDQWNSQGRLRVTHTSLRHPMSITDITGQVNGELHYDGMKQSLTLNGQAEASRLQVRQQVITDAKGMLTYDPTDKTVVFKDFHANVCEGSVSGQMRAGVTGDALRYEMQLEFGDINLNSFLNAGKEPSVRHEVPGRFDGWFNVAEGGLDEVTGGIKPREGRFVFILRQAVLGKLPLLGQIFQVLNLALPDEGTFHQAEIAGDLLEETARFDRIQLHSNALDMTGAGSMQFPEQTVDLIFIVNPPRYLLEVPIITSFLHAVGPKLMQVRVTGPFNNPLVTSVALPDLDETLQQIAPPTTPTPARTPPPPPTR